jgi:hypothetical protein
MNLDQYKCNMRILTGFCLINQNSIFVRYFRETVIAPYIRYSTFFQSFHIDFKIYIEDKYISKLKIEIVVTPVTTIYKHLKQQYSDDTHVYNKGPYVWVYLR